MATGLSLLDVFGLLGPLLHYSHKEQTPFDIQQLLTLAGGHSTIIDAGRSGCAFTICVSSIGVVSEDGGGSEWNAF